MNRSSAEQEHDIETVPPTLHQTMLLLARRLDSMGRRTEQFLCEQLDQLQRAIDEFESEKAAWRRQFQRESQELARERRELEQLRDSTPCDGRGSVESAWGSVRLQRTLAEISARKSGPDPLRFLIQPGRATTMQAGLLIFELSKLNRDLGGRGLRFEIEDVRIPRKRLFSRKEDSDGNNEILELTAFPTLPLSGRGTHVDLDVDISDRLEDWITFKTCLLQSSLVNKDLEQVYSRCRSVKHSAAFGSVVREAARRAESRGVAVADEGTVPTLAFWANTSVNAVQQQLARLENCYERLSIDCGLFIHVEVCSRSEGRCADQP